MERNPTRRVEIGHVAVGDRNPIAVQSMCDTRPEDVEATPAQAEALCEAGAGIVQIAVDRKKDAAALAQIRHRTTATLVVDLQASYSLTETAVPCEDRFGCNPGHRWHHETSRLVADKVRYLAEVAREHDYAIRIGVHYGSMDPAHHDRVHDGPIGATVQTVRWTSKHRATTANVLTGARLLSLVV